MTGDDFNAIKSRLSEERKTEYSVTVKVLCALALGIFIGVFLGMAVLCME